MKYNFDEVVMRAGSDSAKWCHYDADVLPMWVADMDFVSPAPIMQAMKERIDHGIFGYCRPPEELDEVICTRMDRLYNWTVTPDQIVYLPGLVCGLNAVSRAIGEPGDGVLVSTPVYPPFLSAPINQGRLLQDALMAETLIAAGHNTRLKYEIDWDAFEGAMMDQTRLFILCNPHNPVGRAFSREELAHMGELCLKHDIVICSDEIHSDLMLGETTHIPMASLAPEIAARTITLIAPSKTFNVPGLGCSIAIVQNPDLLEQLNKAQMGIVPHVNILGYAATLAAYRDCQDWLAELLRYLTANRDFALKYIDDHLPGIRATMPEATYLMWLDCRESGIVGNPQQFFLEHGKVAFNDGPAFGKGGEGFVRLNFGCPRATVEQGLVQVKEALATL